MFAMHATLGRRGSSSLGTDLPTQANSPRPPDTVRGLSLCACERSRQAYETKRNRRQIMADQATWPIFMTTLKDRKEVAERRMAFQFEKPACWTFKAGQFIDITLPDPPDTDAEGNTRGFSIASAPQEDFLMVATRLRDTAFKRSLKTARLGVEVKVEGPFGNLTLHNNASRPCILLVGGIGITPFRGIVVRAAKEKLT